MRFRLPISMASHLPLLPRRPPGAPEPWLRECIFPLGIRHLSGPRRVDVGEEELVVVCMVRDGAVYLDTFLEHYRQLGASHMVLLDNGSRDETVDRAAGQPDVTLLRTHAPYRNHKVIAKRCLVSRYGVSNWVLCVDIDELFDYPLRHRCPLPAFLAYLNGGGFSAVVAHLLDMFPRGPLLRAPEPWRQTHRFYDLSSISRQPYRKKYGERNRTATDRIEVLYGGIRDLRFGVQPMLTKHPLQFPGRGVRFVNSHNVHGARVADVSAALLHFKYVEGFTEYAETAVTERSFFRDSLEYRSYLEALRADPDLDLWSPSARELHSVDQLANEGFLVVPDTYVQGLYPAPQGDPPQA
ncbi:MAG: glycosyltransferase family 2 protein [Gemmatimonadales bacterium]|nr:MAG: glycosyltransferase family 2 protein [Gemmatimonadales bacterium]